MTVFWHELNSFRRSIIIWSAALAGLIIIFMLIFPSFSGQVVSSQKLFAQLPTSIREILDISLNNFFTIFGFYSYILSFVVTAAAVQAMNYAIGTISKETTAKTIEFLLTKPISRLKILTNKITAVLCSLIMTDVVLVATSYIMAQLVSKMAFSSKILLMLASIIVFVQLMFMVLGILMALLIPKIKSVISVSLPTVFAFYILGALDAILGNSNIRYLSPFRFYNTNYIINNGSFETRSLVIEAIFIVVALAISYAIFIKKDFKLSA